MSPSPWKRKENFTSDFNFVTNKAVTVLRGYYLKPNVEVHFDAVKFRVRPQHNYITTFILTLGQCYTKLLHDKLPQCQQYPTHQKNLNIYTDGLISISISEDLLSECETGKFIFPCSLSFFLIQLSRGLYKFQSPLRGFHTGTADTTVCSEGPTQEATLPGFQTPAWGHWDHVPLQTTDDNTQAAVSSSSAQNNWATFVRSLTSHTLLYTTQVGSVIQKFPKSIVKRERLIQLVEEVCEPTQIMSLQFSDFSLYGSSAPVWPQALPQSPLCKALVTEQKLLLQQEGSQFPNRINLKAFLSPPTLCCHTDLQI